MSAQARPGLSSQVRSAFFFVILCKQIMEWMNEW